MHKVVIFLFALIIPVAIYAAADRIVDVGLLDFKEIASTPATPRAGANRCYRKTDGFFYCLTTGNAEKRILDASSFGSAGQLFRTDGSAIGLSTSVFPNTNSAGDLMYGSSSNNWAGLAIGTANYLLGSNSGGTAPEYKAVTATLAGALTAPGLLRSNTGLVLEDVFAGSNTITIQAATPTSGYVMTLPIAAGTAGGPMLSGGGGDSPMTVGTRSGNTTVFGTTSGTLTSGDCVEFDASGNLIAAGAACGGSGGGFTDYDDVTADGTYTTSGTTTTLIVCGCGGGGGSGGSIANVGGGGGGGAGGIHRCSTITVVPSTAYTVDIGAGGTAGNVAGGNGGVGANTELTLAGAKLFSAPGGRGGSGAASATGGTGATAILWGSTGGTGSNGSGGGAAAAASGAQGIFPDKGSVGAGGNTGSGFSGGQGGGGGPGFYGDGAAGAGNTGGHGVAGNSPSANTCAGAGGPSGGSGGGNAAAGAAGGTGRMEIWALD